jgi:transcriptional regulator with XRE-family HTH domain
MADASLWVLDTDALALAIDLISRHRGISLRTVAAETGLSPSTLTRIKAGQKPDADGLLTLLAWLGYPATFGRRREPEPERGGLKDG